jgi:NADPH:quinone reductase-like Zn-dependent oxidoreductase
MRAICIKEFGGIEKVGLAELPQPTPGPGEALVRLKACALNHLDLWVLKGRPGASIKTAHILGSDGAGVVEALGPDCEGLQIGVGSEILIDPGISCQKCEFCLRGLQSECPGFRILGFQLPGVFAEYAVLPAINLFPKPAHLSWEETAALPLAHLTAWRMLFTRAQLRPGETILIHGIGGGVALAALQLGRLAGADVLATSSSDEKLAQAKALGARAGFNYRAHNDLSASIRAATAGRGVDLAFDTAGAATLPLSLAVLRRGGRIVTCGVTGGAEAALNLQQIYWNHFSLLGSTMGGLEEMRQLLAAVVANRLRPIVDKVFPLAAAGEALRRMQDGTQMGKIVLAI